MQNPSQEHLIIEKNDSYGRIRVVEQGAYRYLEFGDEVEQSCYLKKHPTWLEYDYTRAMLLGALNAQQPASALFLGLGAGSLTNACLSALPLEKAQVVELRQLVLELAQEYMDFTPDQRVEIIIGDALEQLPKLTNTDLIFMDLYTDTGPSAAHLAKRFLQSCQAKLNEGGWLIINQWGLPNGEPLGIELFNEVFAGHFWQCPLQEGNVVLWVPARQTQHLDLKALSDKIEYIQAELGFTLDYLLEQVISPKNQPSK
ncbi:methyltransferase [Pseudomonas sp. F1_0610]|uniref:spermidine synthase n=1 Tax=Pseudomonas sp. F1_0610 TaxID=3114284 RepID=UPI0039C368D1